MPRAAIIRRTGVEALLAAAVIGFVIGRYADKPFGLATKIDSIAGITALVVVAGFLGARRYQHAPWFHPLVFPALYITFTCMAPLAYVEGTGKALGLLTPQLITATVVDVLALTVLGLLAGITVALAALPAKGARRRLDGLADQDRVDWQKFRNCGRWLAAACFLERVAYFAQHRQIAYGFHQFTVTAESQLNTIISGLYLIAVIAIVLGNVNISGRNMVSAADMGMLVGYAVLAALGGSRAVLLTPLLAVVLIRHSAVRKIRLTTIIVGVVLVAYLAQGISEYRSNPTARLGTKQNTLAVNTIEPLDTPAWITAQVAAQVPGKVPYQHGRTYLDATVRLLPGPIARAVFGSPTGTGAFFFKNDILHDTSTNQGYSFSFPSEAYLNFGPAGAFLVAVLLGLLLGWAWRRYPERPTRTNDLLYPILIATLPYGWRSDFLTQAKDVIYPLIILWGLFAVCSRRMSPASEPSPLATV